MGTIILSAIVGHTAWHWMIDRFGVLRQFPWPSVTTADLASGMRWLMLAIAIAGTYVAWRARARIRTRAASVGSVVPRRQPGDVT